MNGVEWNCASTSNTGTFNRSTDCAISGSDHVNVYDTLEINGTNTDMNNLITITAATNQRHFFLTDVYAKLIVRYLKLVGGDVSSSSSDYSSDYWGGSILIYTNGGELNLYSSIVFNNKAVIGGGISARGASSTNKNAIMNIYNSIIHNNEAIDNGDIPGYGGGICIDYAVGTIYNTTIDNNQAGSGGGMDIEGSDVTMMNTIISNNKAGTAGGLYISDNTGIIIRQSSFINNDATGNGNEIYTKKSPIISLINTYFNNTSNNNNNIYVDTSQGIPTWKTCSDNLCTETPFTGTCNKANNKVVACACSSSNTYVTMGINATCKIYTNNCVAGQYISTKRTAANDRKCKTCSDGKFSINKNEDNCTPMTTCVAGQYISTKGTTITDRICKVCIPGTGTLKDKIDANTCDDCKIGTFNNNQINRGIPGICKQCPPGQFAKETKSKQCERCPGIPVCLGRGDCDDKIGACINCKDGWTGKACDVCDSVKWSTKNGLCNKCNDINGFTKRDGICKVKIYILVLRYIGVISGFLGACALIYKLHIFITLKRNGKLRKDLGCLKGLLAVIAYGGKGDHIIVSNDNSTMEENLLVEEERISDDDMLEMPTVRESFSEILDTAGLSEYKNKFAKYGIKSTKYLNDIVEEDLEELGLSGFQRRQFKKAVTKKAKKKERGKTQSNDNNNNVADNNGNVATGNNNNNEGSKQIETMRNTKELKQDKKENKLKK